MDIKLDENAFCLSCNLDRFHYLQKCFESVGLNPPRLFPGMIHPVAGYKGCTLGHQGMIMMARCLNLKYIVIYEDDAYPRPDVIKKFNEIMDELETINWQILVLGRNGEFSGFDGKSEDFWRFYKTDIERNSLKSIAKDVTIRTIDIPRNPNGSHAYIIKREAYNEWLKILTTHQFVDISLGSQNWSKNRILWTKELLFVQKQIDKKCMTKFHPSMGISYIYPYTYNNNYCGCTSIFSEPPKGFVKELVK